MLSLLCLVPGFVNVLSLSPQNSVIADNWAELSVEGLH